MNTFADIPFTTRDVPHGRRLGLYLPGGYWVPKRYFELMWQNANEELPKLDWSKEQTAETMFGGKKCWLAHKVGGRIALGRCLKYFADNDMLPIKVANPKKKGKRKYRRK